MEEHTNDPINPAEALRILSEKIKLETVIMQRLREEVSKVIVGQSYMISMMVRI